MTSPESVPTVQKLAAQIHPEGRAAQRIAAERPITLRSPKNEPIEAVVEDLSRSGFAMSTIADLKIGSVVGLSVAGVLRRRVRVVRRIGLVYGCEFLTPLSDLEVNAALRSGDVVAPEFMSDRNGVGEIYGSPRVPGRKLSYLSRAYILGGLIMSLWAVVIVVAWRVL